ncbi:MAG TPA: alpha/beta hydrolase-fold protein [Catalimonadaceae bacterium]|nr:alpha/beta hydrolase-fold protein [Catalimonadaceae bacterium]HPI11295.1 alpha/beta hydrolase-fold protein [Catalimonadaceae bacterium]
MKREVIHSTHLKREVLLDVVVPESHLSSKEHWRILLVNDGQDAAEFQLASSVKDFNKENPQSPVLAVAIHVGERKQEYGVGKEADYAGRGSRAFQYTSFVKEELFPWLQKQYGLHPTAGKSAIIGFSLGALSAFDVAWNLSSHIGTAGLFSGSFWWRARSLDDGYQASDRIAQKMVRESSSAPELNLWFQTGWLDEAADRDQDGLIDSIGDTVDLLTELEKKGFTPGQNLEYIEIGNGRHDHKTMAKVLPRFLEWWNSRLKSSN